MKDEVKKKQALSARAYRLSCRSVTCEIRGEGRRPRKEEPQMAAQLCEVSSQTSKELWHKD